MKILSLLLSGLLLIDSSSINQKKSTKMEENKIENIVVFGDGLNDMGRWGLLTGYRYPPAAHGFLQGRWTNGKVWIEHVADTLGLQLGFENNFAMGGATTGVYNINENLRTALGFDSSVKLNGMLAQVHEYLGAKPSTTHKTLYVLWAGGHDIGSYLDYGQPDLQQVPPAANYTAAVELLINAGARHFMIGTMPDMGYTPGYYGTHKQKIASELCQQLNIGLEAMIKAFSSKGIRFTLVDGAAIFAEVGNNPGKFGFNHTEPYLPIGIIDFMNPLGETIVEVPNRDKGLNPDEFMNWWAVSASAAMHSVIASSAVKSFKAQYFRP